MLRANAGPSPLPSATSLTTAELQALASRLTLNDLGALAAAIATGQSSAPVSDSRIADPDGVLPPKEDPMYSWISPNPYPHYNRSKVFFRDLQGKRRSMTFTTESEARAWIADAQKKLVVDGRPAEDVVEAYVASLTDRKPSTLATIRYRLMSVVTGRERVPIEAFPWRVAWDQHARPQARASQVGILAALRALVAFAGLPAKVLAGISLTGEARAGKEQLHVDEARRFVAAALEAGDPLAIAAVTAAVVGCRASEVLNLRARDVDDGGALLHVTGTKTRAAKRAVPVDPAFQPLLRGWASGKAPDGLLFEFEPQRVRASKDRAKARRDALLRRVRALCREAGVQEVTSQSLRGLNATLRKLGNASDESITRALGHVDISTTRRSYFAPGVAEQADARRAFGRLLPAPKGGLTPRAGTRELRSSSRRLRR